MQVGSNTHAAYYGASASQAYGGSATGAKSHGAATSAQSQGAAAIVTLSDAAQNAANEPDFSQVVVSARALLSDLLAEVERVSPLVEGKLALDMSRLSQRELFAVTQTDDGLFTSDEREAAALEMERRFSAALAGPAAVSELTGDFRPLYRAGAAHLDAMSAEQKAEPAWKQAREAIETALTRLESDKGALPQGIENDPVALWMASRETQSEEEGADAGSLAENLRKILDKSYADAREAGRNPTFDPANTHGALIDLGRFDADTISTMVNNRDGLFSTDEVRAASTEIRKRAATALSEGYSQAAKSGDPTAFAQNIISLYSSLSPEVRQAAGFNESMLSTAMATFETTSRLMDMMNANMSGGGAASWFGGA